MAMPVKVLHIIDNLGRGGLENGVVNLIRGLDSGTFEHHICAIRRLGLNAERLPESTSVTLLDTATPSSRSQLLSFVRLIRQTRPDIVHTRNWSAIEGVLAARIARVKAVIHSEHGVDGDSTAKEVLRRTLVRRAAFELATQVLSVSHQLRALHCERTGFPKDRVAVIHNGVDTGRYRPNAAARASIRRQLGVSNEFCIASVGNLFPVKDHMTLLRAAAELSPDMNWRLFLIGEGPEFKTLQAFVDSTPALRGRVVFLGLSGSVPELLAGMDAYVLSSISEGISNSLLEAMACGLPVIATDAGGNAEIVVDGISGLLFAVGDNRGLAAHLRRLHEDPARRFAFGRAALQRVTNEFSLGHMIQRYDLLYRGLAASPRSWAADASPERGRKDNFSEYIGK